ncbi:unnamed protein product [Rhizoctonia solani]|uniref:Uncharacterized protein n=1 Tax=Rhizoctonia solani TaxID=456999 RepID=A0A8H2XX18_9AGAM|nr:unnamed protein product [Rhizoctonia solani]
MLASIGGLLALLQGIHMFLFGRPLFWGMFGAKIISPFGFTGLFATKAFKERLKGRYYHSSESITNSRARLVPGGDQAEGHLDMTQFLLDYVIDMGPASLPKPSREEDSDESSDSGNEAEAVPLRKLADVEAGLEVVELEWNKEAGSTSSSETAGVAWRYQGQGTPS